MTNGPWFVYMVRCADDTLYTGITTDVRRRVGEHNSNKLGAKYTKARQPVTLVYSEEVATRSLALRQEAKLRKLSRSAKLALATGSAVG